MGYDSHGVIRICQYVADVKKGRIVPGAPISLKNQTDTTALVDCGWNFGQVGGYRALQCAIGKARTHQISMVVTQRCGHAGRLGAYTQAAAEQGFVALGFCNSPPGDGHFVAPWGGREGRLQSGEGGQVTGYPKAERYAKCKTPKRYWVSSVTAALTAVTA